MRWCLPTLTWWNTLLTDTGHHAGGPHSQVAHNSMRDADRRLGVFLDHLDRIGALDETTILLTSDHGSEASPSSARPASPRRSTTRVTRRATRTTGPAGVLPRASGARVRAGRRAAARAHRRTTHGGSDASPTQARHARRPAPRAIARARRTPRGSLSPTGEPPMRRAPAAAPRAPARRADGRRRGRRARGARDASRPRHP